uniref:Uncharacterized protein n=2 Tax=Bos TaxID=9903 RepID=A0A4W2CEU3_BOBOX
MVLCPFSLRLAGFSIIQKDPRQSYRICKGKTSVYETLGNSNQFKLSKQSKTPVGSL